MAKYTQILDVFLDRMTKEEIKKTCEKWLTDTSRESHRIVTVNPEFVMEATKNRQFRDVLNTAQLRIVDGIGLVFASLALYGWKRRLYRCTGVDLVWILAKYCSLNGKTMYFAGSLNGIATRAAQAIENRYPNVIAGAEMGLPPERTKENVVAYDTALCERINTACPDVLLIAFGAPTQDIWIADNLPKLSSVRIAVGVGGTFDYIAGVVVRAPSWLRILGLEWLYRLIRQPNRINRIITAVIRFPLAVVWRAFIRKT